MQYRHYFLHRAMLSVQKKISSIAYEYSATLTSGKIELGLKKAGSFSLDKSVIWCIGLMVLYRRQIGS